MAVLVMIVLAVNLLCSLFLTGIMWFVQIVHYPVFDEVGRKQFRLFMREHVMGTMYTLAPVMIVEAVFALWLAIAMPSIQVTAALFVLIGAWVSTFMLQLPSYRQLALDKDKKEIKKLIKFNWVRTALWSVRSLLLLSLLIFPAY